jgi:tetratricopeptide (TPR) repeat protein
MKSGSALLFVLILLTPAFGFGQTSSGLETPAGLFAEGNSEYHKGNYATAEQFYSRLLSLGADTGSVYYNLGNACFKQKKLGEAIYYWEKARRKLPGDRDIRDNLELASLMIVDRIETQPDPLPVRLLSKVPALFTIRQESLLALVLFIAANLLFSIFLLRRNSRSSLHALIASLAVAFAFVVFGCSLSWKIYQKQFRRDAVVVEQRADVRSGPGPENITVFTVHEGIQVRLHESTNGWHQISLPNGWSGWVPKNSLRVL